MLVIQRDRIKYGKFVPRNFFTASHIHRSIKKEQFIGPLHTQRNIYLIANGILSCKVILQSKRGKMLDKCERNRLGISACLWDNWLFIHRVSL